MAPRPMAPRRARRRESMMRTATCLTSRITTLVVAVNVAVLLVLSLHAPAAAQGQPVTAQITRVAGPVEVLPKGPPATQWHRATTGMRLGDGDQIRALAGGSADL